MWLTSSSRFFLSAWSLDAGASDDPPVSKAVQPSLSSPVAWPPRLNSTCLITLRECSCLMQGSLHGGSGDNWGRNNSMVASFRSCHLTREWRTVSKRIDMMVFLQYFLKTLFYHVVIPPKTTLVTSEEVWDLQGSNMVGQTDWRVFYWDFSPVALCQLYLPSVQTRREHRKL